MNMWRGLPSDNRRGDPERVKAFTDGVFAIIITILVLEISVPPNLSDQSLAEALDELRPEMTAWVISFLITGMYWVWHRDLFNQVRAVNRDVVWLNLLFMLPAALIPFGASVLGEYPGVPLALHAYGVVLIAASVMRWVLYAYVTRRPELLFAPLSDRQRRIGGLLAGAPIAIYLLAMVDRDSCPERQCCSLPGGAPALLRADHPPAKPTQHPQRGRGLRVGPGPGAVTESPGPRTGPQSDGRPVPAPSPATAGGAAARAGRRRRGSPARVRAAVSTSPRTGCRIPPRRRRGPRSRRGSAVRTIRSPPSVCPHEVLPRWP